MSEPRASTLRPDEPLPEGEEEAPPGTHAMAIARWTLVGLMAVAAASAWIYHASSSGLLSRAEHRFHCPMHPSVVMQHRGECPICGMDLVPIAGATGAAEPGAGGDHGHAGGTTQAAAAAARVEHACPMHPSFVAEEPGACAICGMKLEARAAPPAPAGGEHTCPMHPAFVTTDPSARCPECGMKLVARTPAAPEYTCPMHLGFVTSDPRARCPDCGMKLVPREPVAAASGPGVPGLAEVELTVDRIQLIGMRLAPATRAPLASTVKTVGFVTAPEGGLVSVSTRFAGWVERLPAAETGQLVEKGAVLATVYSPDMVNAQQVFLNAIKWSSDRRLGQGQGGASAPLPTTELERDARQRLELLGFAPEDVETLARTQQPMQAVNVRAPVRGYIARRDVLQGFYVQPGTQLFQIADLSTVWVVADVYESELARVKIGQRATLRLAAWPGETFTGKVQFISPAVSTGSRTLQARVVFRNAGMKLRPGMYGDVELETGVEAAVLVPRDAVVDTGDLQYVFVAKGQGRFAPRRVRTGWSGDGKVAILEGLTEGEKVVTTANFLLDSESRLRAAIDGAAGASGR